jgi:SAM-dependent methyltransferase
VYDILDHAADDRRRSRTACYVSDMDPLAGSSWSAPRTVAGFARSAPNAVLMRFAADELPRSRSARLLDLGCGAGRNAVPLARLGWDVLGIDLSCPMLSAAAQRAREDEGAGRLHLALAPMDRIPARDHSFDFVIAHGIWNLAPSVATFRNALGDAARVARQGAALFVFTFSRSTLPRLTEAIPGEPFVFTQFSGQPQCFLTDTELVAELGAVGFAPEPGFPLREYNRPQPGMLLSASVPAIYEGVFRMARGMTERRSARDARNHLPSARDSGALSIGNSRPSWGSVRRVRYGDLGHTPAAAACRWTVKASSAIDARRP